MHTELAHRNDPATSHIAAEALDPVARMTLKGAILHLLDICPRTVPNLTLDYFAARKIREWPNVKPDSVAKRLSELVKAGRVTVVGQTQGLYGVPVNIYGVAR